MLLQPVVQALMQANNTPNPPNEERAPSLTHVSLQRNPRASDYEENSSEGAPRRRRVPRSHVCAAKRRRPSRSNGCISSRSGNNERGRHRQRQRRSPPSSPPSLRESRESYSTSTDSSRKAHSHKRRKRTYRAWKRARKLEKFKEGGKNISFLVYDGTYGHTDKVLGFIQQFDSAFGGEHFIERSKLRHIAMYFQKSARHWWASLRTKGIDPKTWKACREAIMKQFLTANAKNDVLTSWRGLKLEKGESMQRYVDKFWNLHLKAVVLCWATRGYEDVRECAKAYNHLRGYPSFIGWRKDLSNQ